MPFNGSGIYSPPSAPNFPAVPGAVITASYYNNVINDLGTALSLCLTRDGQSSPSGNIGWAGFNLTGVGNFTAVTSTFSGAIVAGSTLAVTGTITRAGNTVWDAGNDGAGSGLDADLLDGQQGAFYTDIPTRLGYTPVNRAGDAMSGSLTIGQSVASKTLGIYNGDAVNAQRILIGMSGTDAVINATRSSGTVPSIVFKIDNVERMRIDDNGNVGITATLPGVPLDVRGANGLGVRYIETTTGSLNRIQLGTGSGFGYIDATAGSGSTALSLQVASIERMRIETSGVTVQNTLNAISGLQINGAAVATQTYVNGQGFITASALTPYALTSSLSAYALTSSLSAYAPLASPALTGTPTHGGLEIGYRDIPRVTGGIERGKAFATGAGLTLDTGPAAGSTYSIYNNSAAAVTITQGAGLTLRLGGTATTGSRTLAARGFATVWYNSTTEAIIQGSGVT